MTDLTPVGLSKDGKQLILISARGAEFRVPVDHRLRSALRGDARIGQLEMTMESTLRPRDIQARIRAGESAEEVAAAAQTTVDRIMGFAAPVLAERAHVAESARTSSVRRRSGEPGSPGVRTLADAGAAHLRSLSVRDDDVSWDAWRREDGRWTVVADYAADGVHHHAEFSYDVPGRYVTAEDDEARLLTGEMAVPAEAGTVRTGRRLSAVPAQDELPLGDDAIELVREPDPAGHATPEAADDPAADHADADWIASTEVRADGAAPVDEPVDEPAGEHADADHEPTVEVDRPKKKGRSSVPSWDEIMFGGGKQE